MKKTIYTEEESKNIKERLGQIEKDNKVRIILCVEAGSRSWGIPSKDSDYDVRFVFCRPAINHVSLCPYDSEIILNQDGKFDIKGIDLKEAFYRIYNNDPGIYEWLESDIVYKVDYDLVWMLQEAARYYFDSGAMCRKYYGLAKTIFSKDISWVDHVRVKKYLYAFRAILCSNYILDNNEPVPLDFKKLLEYMPLSYADELENILTQKTDTMENSTIDKSYALESHILEELTQLERKMYAHFPRVNVSYDTLDELLFDYVTSNTAKSD